MQKLQILCQSVLTTGRQKTRVNKFNSVNSWLTVQIYKVLDKALSTPLKTPTRAGFPSQRKDVRTTGILHLNLPPFQTEPGGGAGLTGQEPFSSQPLRICSSSTSVIRLSLSTATSQIIQLSSGHSAHTLSRLPPSSEAASAHRLPVSTL